MKQKITFSRLTTLLIMLMVLSNFQLLAARTLVQTQAVISGRVISEEEEPLPGALVVIRSLNIGASTDLDGKFILKKVPAGTHTVEISYLGYENLEMEITVQDQRTVSLGDLMLLPGLNMLLEAVITANTEGQQRAYNQQKNADNIKTVISADLVNRFPDINVGEAMQRVSGVTIQRNNGEGSVVRVRGTPQNFTTVSINGEQIPVTDEGGGRTESLDLISADQLASMEVSKAITPEMDGDAIGGAINLITPTARKTKPTIKGTIGGGYNDLFQRGNQLYKLKYDQRFLDGKLGVLTGASFYRATNGEERYEATYRERRIGDADDPNSFRDFVIDDFRLRPLENRRSRLGLNATIDYLFNENSSLVLKTIYSSLEDESLRRRIRFRPRNNYQDPLNPNLAGSVNNEDVRVRRDVNDRSINRTNLTLSLEGNHLLNKDWKLDYGLTYTDSERELRSDRFVFRERALTLDVNRDNGDFPLFTSPDFDFTNYQAYDFQGFQQDRPISNTGRNVVARLNLAIPFRAGNNMGELKFGGKYRDLENKRRRNTIEYAGFDAPYNLGQVLDGNSNSILNGNYEMGQFPDPDRAIQHFNTFSNLYVLDENASRINNESFFFNATEEVAAAYIQGKIQLNKLRILGGFRYEQTSVRYEALELDIPDEDSGDPIVTTPVSGTNDYDFLLPMLHLRYELSEKSNLRFAYTQSYARPNLADVVPTQNINRADLRLQEGNPQLLPASANNLDLLYERYFKGAGVLSGGVFYKRIENFIFNQTSVVEGGEFDGFFLDQPVNGDLAEILGVEVNFSRNLDFLPGVLSGLGIYMNYTFTNSESSFEFLNEDDGSVEVRDDVPFVGQADHIWNVALSYDRGGFSGRVSLNYNDRSLLSFNSDPSQDFLLDERYQLDINASQKINDNLTVFAEFINLTNDPNVEFQQVRSRITNYELYGWSTRFGINFKF